MYMMGDQLQQHIPHGSYHIDNMDGDVRIDAMSGDIYQYDDVADAWVVVRDDAVTLIEFMQTIDELVSL